MSGLAFEWVECREITDSLLAEIVALYRGAHGRWPFRDPSQPPEAHLRWKASSPASPLAFLIARRGGRLVHACTIRSCRVRLRGRSRLVLQFPDATVAPEEQGRGVYAQALEYIRGPRRQAHDLNFSELPAHPAMARVNIRTGSRLPANRVQGLIRVLRPVVAARAWLASRIVDGPSLPVVSAEAGDLAEPGRGLTLRPATRFGDWADAIFEGAAAESDLIVERSRAHLEWRYGDVRGGCFTITLCCEGAETVGFSVVRTAPSRWDLADLLTFPGRADAARSLLTDVVARASRAGATILTCWLPHHHPMSGLFRRQGFLPLSKRAGFLLRPVDLPPEELDFLEDPRARLHLVLGDSDLV